MKNIKEDLLKKQQFANIPMEEQETIINIDYLKKYIKISTSRKIVFKKLLSLLGTPIEINTIRGKISDGLWIIPFENRNIIKKVLTLSKLIMVKPPKNIDATKQL